jgi:gamma-glutamylputrescine oxidase
MVDAYWLEEAGAFVPRPAGAGRVDVAIVGAGVTGCACAAELARAGLSVRVHDAREIAGGASGRNGGFALRGGAARYDVARESYGEEATRELWRLTERYVDRLESLAGGAFRRVGSLRLAADAEERDDIRCEFEALREDGFDAEWREPLEPPLAGRFVAAILHGGDGSVQPARVVRRLAELASEAGVSFVEHERVAAPTDLDADQVVIATDGSGRGLVPELDDALWPARGQVIATEPLHERLFELPHYARQGFDYWQQVEDGRIVCGGFRDFSIMTEFTDDEVTTPVIQQALDDFVADLLGRRPRITHRWAGVFGMTQDLLPLVGAVPGRDGLWVAAGYAGHGNVLGLMCGELVARAICGDATAVPDLFDPARLIRAGEAPVSVPETAR